MTILETSAVNSLKQETNQKIPKLIWQTAKSEPHPNSHDLIKSFINLNPDYEWLFMDDSRCDNFIKDHFNKEFYNMYKSLPHGVMRADVWRVAVVYVYGGVYVDTDCRCIKPISEWLKPEDSLIVGEEMDNGDLFNCMFAAEPRHPAFLSVLNRFMELYNDPNFLQDKVSPIQNFGQYGFSDGVLRYYKENPQDIKIIEKKTGVFSTMHKYDDTCIIHCVASLSWRDGYDSWRKQQRKLI